MIQPSISPSRLVPVESNLVDMVWGANQLKAPSTEIFHLQSKYTGESVTSKLARMREVLLKSGSPAMIVTQLDEVAWLLNLRASDIPYNPVSFKYLVKASLTPGLLFLHYPNPPRLHPIRIPRRRHRASETVPS